MADNTKIEWTDATWNPVTGCSVVSAGCTNCYAMKIAGGRLKNHKSRKGLTDMSKAGPVWNGKVRFNADWFRYLRADCKKHGIPFFFKQWGAWGKDNQKRSKKANGRQYRGRVWDEMPEFDRISI